jgi:hypothetical protein
MTRKRGVSLRAPRGWAHVDGLSPEEFEYVRRRAPGNQTPSQQALKQNDSERQPIGYRIPCIKRNCSIVAAIRGDSLWVRAPFLHPVADRYELTGDRGGGYGSIGLSIAAIPDTLTILCRRGHATPISRKGLQDVLATLNMASTSRAGERSEAT